MSNAPHTKPARNHLSVVKAQHAEVDARIYKSILGRAAGESCPDCMMGSALFEAGRDVPCEECAAMLVEKAAKLLVGTGHHVERTFAPAVVDLSRQLAASLAVERTEVVVASRFVEEAVPCPGGGDCTFCGGSGKHWAVREVESVGPVAVTETIPSPPPSTQREDGLCPNEACRQWIGTRAKGHEGPDSCGWKAVQS